MQDSIRMETQVVVWQVPVPRGWAVPGLSVDEIMIQLSQTRYLGIISLVTYVIGPSPSLSKNLLDNCFSLLQSLLI